MTIFFEKPMRYFMKNDNEKVFQQFFRKKYIKNKVQWSDGTGVEYTNWGVGQPLKTSMNEECSMFMYGTDLSSQIF